MVSFLDVKGRNIRLSTIPDPESLGKSSATLDDLRKRIYNRTFDGKQPPSSDPRQQQPSADGEIRSTNSANPPNRDPRMAAQASNINDQSTSQTVSLLMIFCTSETLKLVDGALE